MFVYNVQFTMKEVQSEIFTKMGIILKLLLVKFYGDVRIYFVVRL